MVSIASSVTRFVAAITRSRIRVLTVSFVVVCLLGIADYLLPGLLAQFDAPRWSIRVESALVTGCLGGSLIWALLTMVSSRRTYLGAQVRVIANLNHELRNALEVILNSDYLADNDRPPALLESANRIDKALTRLMKENSGIR